MVAGGLAGALVVVLAGTLGCTPSLPAIQAEFRRGAFERAADRIERLAAGQGAGSPDAVLVHLEHGSMARMVGRFEQSDRALARAERLMAQLDRSPGIDLSERASQLVGTPDRIAYEGFLYDRQFAAAYRAVNAMALGQPDHARQHLVRADRWQQKAILAAQARGQDGGPQALAASSQADAAVARALADPRLAAQLRERFGDLDRYRRYADDANPYVDVLRAAYLIGSAQDAADLDVARNLFRRALGMVPDNAYLAADLELADDLSQGRRRPTDLVWVFYEAGLAPTRAQTRINVPVFLVSDRVQVVPIALPRLEFDAHPVPRLEAYADGGRWAAQPVADVERIVAAEFARQLPGLVRRMVASAVFKAGAQYALNTSLRRSDPLVRALAMLGGAIWAVSTNQADLRTWASLPKQVHYLRLPAPPDGRVQLAFGSQRLEVPVASRGVTIVVVRCVRQGLPPMVVSTPLDPGAWIGPHDVLEGAAEPGAPADDEAS